MTNWLSDDEQRAWRAYRRMVLLVDSAVARELAHDAGLSMPDYLVLSALSEAADHRRRLTELAVRMQWSPSRLSHHVTRMEQRSLVTRAECSEDLRAAYVVLTDTGWEAIKAAAPDHVRSVRDHLIDLLDEDEIAALTSIGEKVIAHFGADCLDRPVPRDDVGRADYAAQSANRSPVSSS
ncbi:MAG TPA: MarR family transcriptional regulator [Jatrophihabitantaceae bacterium]